LLALSLTPPNVTLALSTLAAAVTSSPDGAGGEDYLGYTDHDHLLGTLTRGLGQLMCDGIVRNPVVRNSVVGNGVGCGEDSPRFRCDRPVLRAAVRGLGSYLGTATG
jgi:hypothetical protein